MMKDFTKYIKMTDFSKVPDKTLLELTDARVNLGPIPMAAVTEVQRRGIREYVNRTINSFDFDKDGNWVS